MERVKNKISAWGVEGMKGMNGQSTEDFQGSEITLYDTVMMDTYVQTHKTDTTKSEP